MILCAEIVLFFPINLDANFCGFGRCLHPNSWFLGGSGLDAVLQAASHESRAEANSHLPCPPRHSFVDAAHDPVLIKRCYLIQLRKNIDVEISNL